MRTRTYLILWSALLVGVVLVVVLAGCSSEDRWQGDIVQVEVATQEKAEPDDGEVARQEKAEPGNVEVATQEKAEPDDVEVATQEKAEPGNVEVATQEKTEPDDGEVATQEKTESDNGEIGEVATMGKIAFTSERDGNAEIYVMDADGTNQINLTGRSTYDSHPSWSPDGSKIAFASYIDGHWGIYYVYAVNADDLRFWGWWTDPIIAFDSPGLRQYAEYHPDPSWSPDGTKIAFESPDYHPGEIKLTDADITTYRKSNKPPTYAEIKVTTGVRGDNPSWSPDCSQIAFAADRVGNAEIYVMDSDGTNQINLTSNNANDAHPSWSADGSKIAFTSYRDGNAEIYVMDADGTSQKRLTTNSTNDEAPTWSPGGSKIAFMSDRDGNWEIYVMDANGTNQINLTSNNANDRYPSWGPATALSSAIAPPRCPVTSDGRIVFSSCRSIGRRGECEMFVMDADGFGLTRLHPEQESRNISYPSWSPDGSKIAFVSNHEEPGWSEIYVMDADGSNQTRLTTNAENDRYPSWSPDGTKIAFDSFDSDHGGNHEIYVMDPDGSNLTNLTNHSDIDEHPSWSPDGSKIAFMARNAREYGIYVMDADGSNRTRLTNNGVTELGQYVANDPSWSPDGSKIAFVSNHEEPGWSEIYVMDADGSNQTRLITLIGYVHDPSWSPDGSKIAFMADGDIYVVELDSLRVTNLTRSEERSERHPAWGPAR